MKKIVFLTGAGVSAESGIKTFRSDDGLWENHPVEKVADICGWYENPLYVNQFYNMLRSQLQTKQPNLAHRLIAQLEEKFDVVVVTQNVDNLHERAGSSSVIHLHGELMKVCSSKDKEDVLQHRELTENDLIVKDGELSADGSLLRPYIVWFGEPVPMLDKAIEEVSSADVVVVVGTSFKVYPAAGLIHYARKDAQLFCIDPNQTSAPTSLGITFIKKKATEGMQELMNLMSF